MNGIYYKEGIYVVIDNDKELEDCIYHDRHRNNVLLFGGRVKISSIYYGNGAYFVVDGIKVVNIGVNEKLSELSLSQIASHLNAIGVNGVDTFMQNYKKSIEFAYQELKEISRKVELQLESEHREGYINKLLLELKKIKDLLISVLSVLFSLKTYMIAGIENEKAISVYNSIIDSFS